MKIALFLYGMFRHPDTAHFWSRMLPKGDLFVCATFTRYPDTKRSNDRGPLYPNITFSGLDHASVWSVIDQTLFDSLHGIDALVANKKDRFNPKSTNKASLKNAIRVIFQLRMLRDMYTAQNANHSHAILTRVDLLFVRPIVSAEFNHNVIVPNYADFDGYNDRFAAGPIKEILLLMDRLEVWKRTNKLAEKLMLATFRTYRIMPRRAAIGFNRRVRTGGILHKSQYIHGKGCALDIANTMSELLPYATTLALCENSAPFLQMPAKKRVRLNS